MWSNLIHVPISCMWWMKFIQYGPKSILVVNFTHVIKFSHMILFSSMDQFDFRVEFHSYSHITPLDFTHVKTFMHGNAIKIIHFHPQWSNVHQCGESFIHDIVQFLLHNISFDFTGGQFHPCWKSHPCHEIYPIYQWHPCARAQPPTLVADPVITSQVYSKILIFIFTKIVIYIYIYIR